MFFWQKDRANREENLDGICNQGHISQTPNLVLVCKIEGGNDIGNSPYALDAHLQTGSALRQKNGHKQRGDKANDQAEIYYQIIGHDLIVDGGVKQLDKNGRAYDAASVENEAKQQGKTGETEELLLCQCRILCREIGEQKGVYRLHKHLNSLCNEGNCIVMGDNAFVDGLLEDDSVKLIDAIAHTCGHENHEKCSCDMLLTAGHTVIFENLSNYDRM